MRWVMRLGSVAPFTAMTLMFAALVPTACGSSDSSFEVAPTEVTKVREEAREGHTFIEYMAKQPAFRDRASDEYVEQRVYVGIPDGVGTDAPVIFFLGQEGPIPEEVVGDEPVRIDMPVTAILAEHRGYGQSLSTAEDQTTPSYVSAREAVEDFHEVARALQKTYTGPWFAWGGSYVGGVVLQYAGKYPDDVAGVASLCGVVDLPVLNTAYDGFARDLLGEESYAQVVGHIENLQPYQLFDQNWIDLEFFEGSIVPALTQYPHYQSFVPLFKNLVATQTTEELIVAGRELDEAVSGGAAANWAANRALTTLSREEALEKQPSERYYMWQQCTDIGLFEASGPDGIWQRDEDDRDAECQAVFGVDLVREHLGHRDDVLALEAAGVPLVYESGGKDPYSAVGLEVPPESALINQQEDWSEYEASYGRHFHAPEGFHCPSAADDELVQAIWASLFELAGVEVGTVE